MFSNARVLLARWKSFDFLKGRFKRGGAIHTRHTHGSRGRYKRLSSMYGLRDGRRHAENHMKGGLGVKLGGGLFGLRIPRQQALSSMSKEEFDIELHGHPNITNPYRDMLDEHPQLKDVMENAKIELSLVVLMPRTSRVQKEQGARSDEAQPSTLPHSWELVTTHLAEALVGNSPNDHVRQRSGAARVPKRGRKGSRTRRTRRASKVRGDECDDVDRESSASAPHLVRPAAVPLLQDVGNRSEIHLCTTGASVAVPLNEMRRRILQTHNAPGGEKDLRTRATTTLAAQLKKFAEVLYADHLRGAKVSLHAPRAARRASSSSPHKRIRLLNVPQVPPSTPTPHVDKRIAGKKGVLAEESLLSFPPCRRESTSAHIPPAHTCSTAPANPNASQEDKLVASQQGYQTLIRQIRRRDGIALCLSTKIELVPSDLVSEARNESHQPGKEPQTAGAIQERDESSRYVVADVRTKQYRESHRVIQLLKARGGGGGGGAAEKKRTGLGASTTSQHSTRDLIRWFYLNEDPRAHFNDILKHGDRHMCVHLFVDASQASVSSRVEAKEASKEPADASENSLSSTALQSALQRQKEWFPSHTVPSLVPEQFEKELVSMDFHAVRENICEAMQFLAEWRVDQTWNSTVFQPSPSRLPSISPPPPLPCSSSIASSQ